MRVLLLPLILLKPACAHGMGHIWPLHLHRSHCWRALADPRHLIILPSALARDIVLLLWLCVAVSLSTSELLLSHLELPHHDLEHGKDLIQDQRDFVALSCCKADLSAIRNVANFLNDKAKRIALELSVQ